jgi:hypothetical protein
MLTKPGEARQNAMAKSWSRKFVVIVDGCEIETFGCEIEAANFAISWRRNIDSDSLFSGMAYVEKK